jgi:hypothetical protein
MMAAVRALISSSQHPTEQKSEKKRQKCNLNTPGIEPGTLAVLKLCDNHYTMRPHSFDEEDNFCNYINGNYKFHQ